MVFARGRARAALSVRAKLWRTTLNGIQAQINRPVEQCFQIRHATNPGISHVLVCLFSLLLRLVWHRALDGHREG